MNNTSSSSVLAGINHFIPENELDPKHKLVNVKALRLVESKDLSEECFWDAFDAFSIALPVSVMQR